MKGTTQTEKIGTTPDDATATAGRHSGQGCKYVLRSLSILASENPVDGMICIFFLFQKLGKFLFAQRFLSSQMRQG
jgi:hypothetical protein